MSYRDMVWDMAHLCHVCFKAFTPPGLEDLEQDHLVVHNNVNNVPKEDEIRGRHLGHARGVEGRRLPVKLNLGHECPRACHISKAHARGHKLGKRIKAEDTPFYI